MPISPGAAERPAPEFRMLRPERGPGLHRFLRSQQRQHARAQDGDPHQWASHGVQTTTNNAPPPNQRTPSRVPLLTFGPRRRGAVNSDRRPWQPGAGAFGGQPYLSRHLPHAAVRCRQRRFLALKLSGSARGVWTSPARNTNQAFQANRPTTDGELAEW